MTSTSPQLIRTDSARDRLIDVLTDETCIAVDTEFHAERRYSPELMLVQLATADGRSWVVDPLDTDIGPLAKALAEKILLVHSGQVDLQILADEADQPMTRAIDVQIAGGMLGLGYPTRLDAIVSEVLGQSLDKGPTLSDWSVRPLKPAQIAYALADAQILFPLAQAMEKALTTEGRWDWVREESEAMAERASREPEVKQHWTRWDIAPRLDAQTQGVMTVLNHWRDQHGRDKNQPPHFILSDGLCLDIARRKPRTVSQLTENRRIPHGLVRRLGQSIVDVVGWAIDNEPERPLVPSTEEQAQAKALELWASAISRELNVAPRLLLPEHLSIDIAHHGIDALTGWRSALLTQPLAAFLSGETALFYGPKGAVVRGA